ncbi:MAG: cobaltochelatase subunit CobN [Bacteroidota bacterium]
MHLISTIPGGWNPNEEGVFYIEQQPGEVLFLSAADTELYSVNQAYHELHKKHSQLPSLRLANLTYFKQELTIDTYLDEVVSEAKVVVLRLLGGVSYFSYLCQSLVELAEEKGFQLLLLPGDDRPDVELTQLSNVPLPLLDNVWKYFVAGGLQNITQAVLTVVNLLRDTPLPVEDLSAIPNLFLYHPDSGILEDKKAIRDRHPAHEHVALAVSYRSHYLAGNLKPIEALTESMAQRGITLVTLMALSFRDAHIEQDIHELLASHHIAGPDVLINTTGFSINSFQDTGHSLFDRLHVPVIQAIMASCNRETWETGQFGLPPTDVAMNIALPEVDGKIITTAISFKESGGRDELTDSEIVQYEAHLPGCESVTRLASNWINLQKKSNDQKKVALILPNYPNKNSRLANGVGLDTPASTVAVLHALHEHGYVTGNELPRDSDELIGLLTEGITNDLTDLPIKEATVTLSEALFTKHYDTYSEELKEKITSQWGTLRESPNYQNGHLSLPGFLLGNVFVSIQPSRGYNLDIQASYHSPDLPPTYAYLAYYIWVQEVFKADAIIHVGKHGNLEWLPGKSVALDPASCFPSAIFSPIPHFYPFIINDPGEGTQAKRRNHAVIIDHLIPPMTRADSYGDLLQLELLIDEYYESALVDGRRAALLKKKIETLVNSTHLKTDLNSTAEDVDELLETIDGYLCELKEAQIRGGLHIFGELPIAEKLADLVIALHRLPHQQTPSLLQALAHDLDAGFDPLDVSYEAVYDQELAGTKCRTYGKAVAVLETLAKEKVHDLLGGVHAIKVGKHTSGVLDFIRFHTLPLLAQTSEEVTNLLQGLEGAYVAPGGSGAPTRGRLDILPTGRNFYSVDVRTIPSPAAYELGKKSATHIIERYMQENGDFPRSIGISVWGTSTMRTSGDDIAQALALMGVKPVWQGANRRVKDFEVISLLELKRPRIDVTLRISGFFRDAFPDLISLFNAAVDRVARLDESIEENPIRERFLRETSEWQQQGLELPVAEERALYRVFGSRPGAYGAGLQGLIDEGNWTSQADLAQVYINWSGYAYYGAKNEGRPAHETFKTRLAGIEIVMQNQDNREHDLLDSDDYYQFQGGLTAAVTSEKGTSPTTYFGDHSRPENPRIKSLKEELLKVYRSRVVNPKWMQGMRDHGYKGAFEMAATMDYLFAYDATTGQIDDFMYEGITEAYLLDEENQAFIRQHNPWALQDMSGRMLEAIQRKLWSNPSEEMTERLKQLYVDAEGALE